jgi:hypothetical protein
MKKKLDVTAISNELEGASVFFAAKKDASTPTPPAPSTTQSTVQSTNQSTHQPVDQLTNKQIIQSPEQPTDQVTNTLSNQPMSQTNDKPVNRQRSQSPNPPIKQAIDTSMIIGKPKGFYISEKQDTALDEAVRNVSEILKGKVSNKIDRSTIIRLVLEEANLEAKETAEKLANRLVSRLINQLTS